MTKYQIVEVQPVFCQITDGMIGNTYTPLPFEFFSLQQAERTAGELSQRDYDDCGDGYYFVKIAGEPTTKFGQPNRAFSPRDVSDDVVPF